jgi:hypothetical protein
VVSKSLKKILLLIPVILLSGCKVAIKVPEGGRVISVSGAYACSSGETCVVDVSDIYFNETFVAQPSPGFYFAGWKKNWRGLCGGNTAPCNLDTSGFKGQNAFLDLLASDETFFLTPVFQTSPPTDEYNVDFWRNLSEEIDSGKYASNGSLYRYLPSVANCDPGELSDAAKARAGKVLNEIRKLHRLPKVKYDGFYDAEVQAAALVHRANDNTSHNPPASARCYSQLAHSGASSSNLHRSSSHENDDPASNIISWIDDKFNVSNVMGVGHRRWALYPELGYLAYGQVKGASAQKVFRFGREPSSSPPANLQFVAFPYRTYPYLLAEKEDKPTPWSLSLTPEGHVEYSYDYFRNSRVIVSEWDSGVELMVRSLYTDSINIGTPNVLSWIVDDYEYDKTYRVRIEDITYPDGNIYYLEYYVHLDFFNIFNVIEPLEKGDKKDGNKLIGTFFDSDDKDSYLVPLSGTQNIRGESEYSNQAFFVLVYNSKKKLVASYDREFTKTFENGEYTVVVSPCDENGLCYRNVRKYNVSIN